MDIQTLRRGETAGILCLVIVVLDLAAQFYFGVGKSVTGDLVALALYLAVCVTYFVFLFTVREIVKTIGDISSVSKMRDFVVAMVIACLFMAPLVAPILVPDSLEKVLGLVSVILIAILGIVSIRIARFFENLEGTRTLYGKRAGKWLRISGWLMATVILAFVGGLVSLIADYYLWRIVRQERLSSANTAII